MSVDLSVYLVTDRALCGERGVVETVRQAVAGGVGIVQLRDKTASDAEIVEQLAQLSSVVDGRARLVVNDRLDAALAARSRGARVDGVHLGQSDASALLARSALGPDAIVGVSAHTIDHIEAVRAMPVGTVDYLGIGVIRPTNTKPDHPPALGVSGFAELAAASPVPCVAIGGVGKGDVASLRAAGAAGIAVVSAICAAPDARAAAAEFVAAMREGAVPRVLSIAGSDPSGGAGIQADLKSIAANGGYGMAAITALTVQNTLGVHGSHTPPASFVRQQLDALDDDIVIDAVKTGVLANSEVTRVVTDWVAETAPPILVVDPVTVASSGDSLLDRDAHEPLRRLMRSATVVTPNTDELTALTGRTIDSWPRALAAGEALASEIGTTVLVKGGHLEGDTVRDAIVDASGVRAEFADPRIRTRNTHGTGCSLSSAIATNLARGMSLAESVAHSREWLRASISAGAALAVGRGTGPVHHFASGWESPPAVEIR